MNYSIAQFDSQNPEHLEAAGIIARRSGEAASMKTYTPTDIKSHYFGLIAYSGANALAGYIAAVELEETGKKVRIGAFTVAQELQGNGIGVALIRELASLIPQAIPEIEQAYAYVNPASQKRFQAAGFTPIGTRQPPSDIGCNNVVELDYATAGILYSNE